MSILRANIGIGLSLFILSEMCLVILISCLEREKAIGIDEVDQSFIPEQTENKHEGSIPIAPIIADPAAYLHAMVTVSGIYLG